MEGPLKGSARASKVDGLHTGSQEHDVKGGFASNPELASEAGKKGGNKVKEKYGPEHYSNIGRIGGNKIKQKRGSKFFAEIGRRGGRQKAANARAAKAKAG